jgi:hypothetical protein
MSACCLCGCAASFYLVVISVLDFCLLVMYNVLSSHVDRLRRELLATATLIIDS